MPLGKRHDLWPPYRVTRSTSWYRHHRLVLLANDSYPRPINLLADACWRALLRLFGRSATSSAHGAVLVTFFPAMNFITSRSRIEQYPLATWAQAHRRLVSDGHCLPGPVASADAPGGYIRDDDPLLSYAKATVAEGMEALAHVIFGNHELSESLDALPVLPAVNCSLDTPPARVWGCWGGGAPCTPQNRSCCPTADS